MAGHRAGGDTEAETPGAAPDPAGAAAATALALGLAGASRSLSKAAATFLEEQTRMARLQMEHLHEQRALQIEHLKHQDRHLRLKAFDERLGVALKLLTIAVGSCVAIALAAMVWNAANDRSLVVQTFAVPPELTQRGVTGQVLAAQVLDRIAELDAQTDSMRAGNTYANDWGDDVKVEIPETGVSVGELDRWLRRSLGQQTRISGELFRTDRGLVLNVRAGAQPGREIIQQGEDFDGMVAGAAEALYRDTQPYRYSKYLERKGRLAESMALALSLTRGPAEEQPWAWSQVANLSLLKGDMRAAIRSADHAIALRPGLAIGLENRGGGEQPLGWDERAFDDFGGYLSVLDHHPEQVTPVGRTAWSPLVRAIRADYLGDRQTAAAQFAIAGAGPDFQQVAERARPAQAYEMALNHDVRASTATPSPSLDQIGAFTADIGMFPFTAWAGHAALDDWNTVLADLDRAEAAAGGQGAGGQLFIERWIRPMRAQALARLGRGAQARLVAGSAPLDCYACLRMRGVAAAAAGDAAGADRWFVEAIRQAPSLPAAYAERGQALLARGDLDGAIVELKLAHDKGPHWADPLELWGEALMDQGDARAAAARFAEAGRLAPHWGRAHLRWGEALLRQGRVGEARAQFRTAADLDLSLGDRAAVGVFLARTAPRGR